MIVSRAPVRFSLGGGGTDLPAYASRFGGFVVSAAIDKYVYVTASRRFHRDIRLAYSRTELKPRIDEIEHPIFREALRLCGIEHSIELTSVAELPSNTGLGSSSAFTVALMNALHAYRGEHVSTRQLAEEACHLEIDVLREPVGRQDQYIAAFGGVTALTFEPDGAVHVEPVAAAGGALDALEANLVAVYTGVERPARVVLAEQGERLGALEPAVVEGMHRIKEIGREVHRLLTDGDVDRYGELLHEHWMRKRGLASKMSDGVLDEHYEAARRAGAIGGKLMGAGGGGFFLFYVRPAERRRLVEAMQGRGLRLLDFRFDLEGARIVADLIRPVPRGRQ
jgi:D-glycero-alpha-D-manno-heptose-7-phosphate kinase